MTSFSDRIGVTNPPEFVVIEAVSGSLRNRIWNYYVEAVPSSKVSSHVKHQDWLNFGKRIARIVLNIPADEVHLGRYSITWVKDHHFTMEWYDFFNTLEMALKNSESSFMGIRVQIDEHEKVLNAILERENSGYRFINYELVPISNEVEITEVSQALEDSKQFGLNGAETHLKTSLRLFSLRPNPDYRNSVKESISAVESAVRLISGDTSGSFKTALKKLDSKLPIHGALKEGFQNIYGYTSDEDGIRHAILDEPTVHFDEAKFMLVACSAFVNYLIAKANTAGLLPSS